MFFRIFRRNRTQTDRLLERIQSTRSKFKKLQKLESEWRKESLVNSLKPQRMIILHTHYGNINQELIELNEFLEHKKQKFVENNSMCDEDDGEENIDWIDSVQEAAIVLSDIIIKQLEPIMYGMLSSKCCSKYLELEF